MTFMTFCCNTHFISFIDEDNLESVLHLEVLFCTYFEIPLWGYIACEVTVLFNSTNHNTVFGFTLNGRLHTGYVRYIQSICHRQNRVRVHCSQGKSKLYVAIYCITISAFVRCVWSWQ
jgi:hypothetical protein